MYVALKQQLYQQRAGQRKKNYESRWTAFFRGKTVNMLRKMLIEYSICATTLWHIYIVIPYKSRQVQVDYD